MTVRATRNQGKSMFVKEVLNDDPQANHQAVNAAWRADGMSGSISPTLVSRVRSRLGLTGASRGGRRKNAKATGARRGRPPGTTRAAAAAGTIAPQQHQARGRKNSLMDLEVEFDRLLMKVAAIGTLPEVEDSLRKTRRQLYAELVAPVLSDPPDPDADLGDRRTKPAPTRRPR